VSGPQLHLVINQRTTKVVSTKDWLKGHERKQCRE